MIILDIILIAVVLGVMVLGFFIMRRLDKFLNENRNRIEQDKIEKEPSCCTMLTTKLSDEELIKQIRTYEEKYGNAYITLYQNEDDLYDELFDGKR